VSSHSTWPRQAIGPGLEPLSHFALVSYSMLFVDVECRRTLAAVHSGADLSAAIDGVLGYDAGECKGKHT
jgi:hypothetical protein